MKLYDHHFDLISNVLYNDCFVLFQDYRIVMNRHYTIAMLYMNLLMMMMPKFRDKQVNYHIKTNFA